MPDRDVMTRAETRTLIIKIAAAAMGGNEMPTDLFPSKKYIRSQDAEDAMDEVIHLLADQLDRIPEEVSSDLQQQEAIRRHFDEMVVQFRIVARKMVEDLNLRYK